MPEVCNIGIIGLGYWGPNLLRVFNAANNSKVLVGCDVNEAILTKFRRLYPQTSFVTDLEDIFKNKEIDAVAIATRYSPIMIS